MAGSYAVADVRGQVKGITLLRGQISMRAAYHGGVGMNLASSRRASLILTRNRKNYKVQEGM